MKKLLIISALLIFSNINAQKQVDCDKFLKILNKNRILVQKGNAIGVIDTLGNFIIDFKYKAPYSGSDEFFIAGNKTLLTTDLSSKKKVLLNINTGKNIIENYKNIINIRVMNEYAIISTGKSYTANEKFYINSNGKKMFNFPKSKNGFQKASYISENAICMLSNPEEVQFNKNGKYYYVDTLGIKKFDKLYEKAGDFSNGLAVNAIYKNGIYYYGFIDNKGNQKIDFLYTKRPTDFSDNVSRVKNKNRMYGYIDNNGKLIIKPKYYYASGFYKGFALVREGTFQKYGNWKIIDKTGTTIKEFITLQNINLTNRSDFTTKKITSIKQIIDEKLFKVKFNSSKSYQSAIVDIDLNIAFNKTNKMSSFKNGLATFSNYDKSSKTTTYGVINNKKRIILINETSQF